MCQSNYLEISRAAAVREAVRVPIIGIIKCNGCGVTLYEAAAALQAAGITIKPDKLRLKDLAVYLYHLLREWRHPPCVVCNGQKMKVPGRIGNQYTLFDATGIDVKTGDLVEWDGNLMLSSCERRFV